jgi:hypothetical protein
MTASLLAKIDAIAEREAHSGDEPNRSRTIRNMLAAEIGRRDGRPSADGRGLTESER